jgi:hypothetical protein
MDDPRGKAVLGPIIAQIEAQARKVFSGGDERYGNDNAVGMDIMIMFSDMPIISVLMFFPGALPKHPDEMADEMLKQAHSLDK